MRGPIVALFALTTLLTSAAVAEDLSPPPVGAVIAPAPLDPAQVAHQLWLLSDRNYRGSASYEIWNDGTIHFYVSLPNNISVLGSGSTTEEALEDLRKKSDVVAKNLVPEAEVNTSRVLSLVEGIKSMLFRGRPSQ